MIYHLCHLYFWKVVKMDKMKNHPTRVSTNQCPQLYIEVNAHHSKILTTLLSKKLSRLKWRKQYCGRLALILFSDESVPRVNS